MAYEIYPGVIAAPEEAQRTVASIRNWLREYVSSEYRVSYLDCDFGSVDIRRFGCTVKSS